MLRNLLIFVGLAAFCECLQCWRCVGKDCDSYKSTSKNWELVSCPDGSVCQETQFSFYSNRKNASMVAHTVRSCSYETGCTWDRSKRCQKSSVQYAGRGCVDRFCCAKDKCNDAGYTRISAFLLILSVLNHIM